MYNKEIGEERLHKAIGQRAIDKKITMRMYVVELIEKGKSIGEVEGTEESEE